MDVPVRYPDLSTTSTIRRVAGRSRAATVSGRRSVPPFQEQPRPLYGLATSVHESIAA